MCWQQKGAVLLWMVAAGVAHAQPAQLAREFQAGVDAFRLGHYDEARTHLEAARELDPRLPGPHRFLAAVAQAQGRWDDCLAAAHTAIELNPQSTEIADTRKLHADCRIAAGRAPYRGELGDSAAIAVTSNVSGATVKINGLTYGGTPLAPRPITAGALAIEVDKAGWKSASTSVTAPAGIVTDVVVELEPDPSAQTETLLTDPTLGAHREPHAARPAPASPGARRTNAHLYMLGAGSALVAAGFVTAMVSRAAADEARDIVRVERARDPSVPLSETAASTPVRTRADLAAARDRASRWSLLSNLAYGGGIVTVGIAAYLYYRRGRPHPEPPPVAVVRVRGGAIVAGELSW